jgi:serine/threonine protein kinase
MKPARTVDQQRWQRLERIWGEASKLDRAERESFVMRQAMDDEERQELLDMLVLDRMEDGAGPLSRTIGNTLDRAAAERQHALINKVVGRYRIVSILGRGGSGTVYLGERADKAYSAQVAVKIVDESAATSFGHRFQAERQILASLNHPHIARLLDAGESDTHQPYLVMEYVHGVTVDRYCDSQRLDLRGRLELFLKICSAVQFAHQHLIVHRDLKPANILVTADGTPKLLDFGIAKLLHASDLTLPQLTRMNDRLLTPEYASPEQILGNNVTTASDVYSLGVVLYQLLSGLRPYTLSSSAASQLELERSICISDPMRPSAAVLAAIQAPPAESRSSIAELSSVRATTPERLARQLAGDVDAIVMRTLRKEPSHRYGSIDQLIADIRRHLANEPVQARQGNWIYYSQRFIRRNRWPVAASASFVLFLIAMTTVLSISRTTTQRALESEAAVSEFMGQIFEAADPYVHLGHELTARELLDQAARSIEMDRNLPPEARARALTVVGNSYRRMGLPSKAAVQLAQAVRLEKSLEPGDSPRVAGTLIALARAEREAGLLEAAAQHFDEAHQIGVANDAELKAKLLAERGKLQVDSSQVSQALESFTAALELMRAARGPRDPEVGSILSEIANIHTWTDNLTAAEAAAREAVDIYADVDPRQPDRVKADGFLAEILFLQGRIDEAAPIFERVLAAQRQLFKNNSLIGDTLASLAQVRLAQGDPAEAEKLVREALATHRVSGSTAHAKVLYLQVLLGTVLLKQSRYDDAAAHLSATLESLGKSLPADHQYVASTEHYLGEALAAVGKLVDAEGHLTAAMNRWKRTDAPPWRSARSASALGEVLHRQGKMVAAETHLTSSYAILAKAPGVDQETREKARVRITNFYIETDQRSKLEDVLRQAHPDATQQDERTPF